MAGTKEAHEVIENGMTVGKIAPGIDEFGGGGGERRSRDTCR